MKQCTKRNFGNFEDKPCEPKLKVLKSDMQRQQNVFTVANKSSEVVVCASFALLQITAK